MSLELIKKYKIRAKKGLWQNFLVNEEIVKEIAIATEVKSKNIVEVWPGYGALTEVLLKEKPKSLNLVELDNDMVEILEDRINNWDFDLENVNFKINNIDVLKYEPTSPQPSPLEEREQEEYSYSVIANIPYYITSPILRHFLYEVENKPKDMVILMQKDVWDKIIAGQTIWKKAKVRSSVLGLIVAKKAYVDEVIVVWKENFIPAPKINSSVVVFESHDKYREVDDKIFLETIKKWFREPRKKLIKNFINCWYEKKLIMQVFKDLWIDELVRGEDLDIATWCELVWVINN